MGEASTPVDRQAVLLVRTPEMAHPEDVSVIGTGQIDVLIVDDQEAFRVAARTVVAASRGFTVAAEAATGEEAVELSSAIGPDIVLMDINLPGIDGLQATAKIVEASPQVRVLLMSTYRIEDLPADARESGATAYVHKEDLSPAVLREFAEGRYVGGF
jgi:two-component system invasion response regulator UvrY